MVYMTVDFISQNNKSVKYKRDESSNQYIKRITHLYMSEKHINKVGNLSKCKCLCVLYLYDNNLTSTFNLGTATSVTHLYLQNNNIKNIEGFEHLKRLNKVFLGHNEISLVEGLHSLPCLRELHVENQRLSSGEKLLFEPRTMFSLSNSLEVFNISGNNLDSIISLSPLKKITSLHARNNQIKEMTSIEECLSVWRILKVLDLTGNPVFNASKYRDQCIISSSSLELLDGKEIKLFERQFLVRWKESREMKRKPKVYPGNTEYKDYDLYQPYDSNIFKKNTQYIRKGLPRAQKRFEAVLEQTKTKSVPSSAINNHLAISNNKLFEETEFENGKNNRLTSVSLTRQVPYLHGDNIIDAKLEEIDAKNLIEKVKKEKTALETDFLNDSYDLRDHGDVSIVEKRKTSDYFMNQDPEVREFLNTSLTKRDKSIPAFVKLESTSNKEQRKYPRLRGSKLQSASKIKRKNFYLKSAPGLFSK